MPSFLNVFIHAIFPIWISSFSYKNHSSKKATVILHTLIVTFFTQHYPRQKPLLHALAVCRCHHIKAHGTTVLHEYCIITTDIPVPLSLSSLPAIYSSSLHGMEETHKSPTSPITAMIPTEPTHSTASYHPQNNAPRSCDQSTAFTPHAIPKFILAWALSTEFNILASQWVSVKWMNESYLKYKQWFMFLLDF